MTKNNTNTLAFLPLGGAGEIGMNLNLYHHAGEWLMVDLGISFNDTVGIEVIMPNPQFIVERRKDLVGLVLTHAHEDHIGAVPYIWPMLKCPIYASPFTAALVRGKLMDAGIDDAVIHEIKVETPFKVGSFELKFIELTHSIPEPNALVIETPMGKIFHTGDWKFDPDPVIGKEPDYNLLKKLGDEGVLAMVCDSTNIFSEGTSGSEAAVRKELIEAVAHHPEGKVFVSCFASNLARLDSIVAAAEQNGRKVVLAGRSFKRMTDVAHKLGYLKIDTDRFISIEQAQKKHPDTLLYVCTGSQGEYNAMLSRLTRGAIQDIKIEEGDTVIFSSRVIPGNEKRIGILKNSLISQGIHVVTQRHYDIHVSGHPAKDELRRMYELIRPKIAIPVHGELQHMVEHGRLAKKCGVEEILIGENGTMMELAPGTPEIVAEVPVGRLGLDGSVLVSFDHASIKERRRLAVEGVIFVSVVYEQQAPEESEATFSFMGVMNANNVYAQIEEVVKGVLNEGPLYADVAEEIRIRVRRVAQAALGKKPQTIVHLSRV